MRALAVVALISCACNLPQPPTKDEVQHDCDQICADACDEVVAHCNPDLGGETPQDFDALCIDQCLVSAHCDTATIVDETRFDECRALLRDGQCHQTTDADFTDKCGSLFQ